MSDPAAAPVRRPSVVGVADRTPVFLQGLAGALAAEEVDVVAVQTAPEVRDLIGKSPDALVIDLRLLDEDRSLCAAARDQGVALVVTVADDGADRVLPIVEEGVNGLWDRDGDVTELRRVVSGALSGSSAVSTEVGATLLERIAAASAASREMAGRLTNREHEILDLMAGGAGNRAIADALFISENTVRNHVRNVLDKLQARSRTEAVVRAVRAGLIRLG